MAKHVGLGYRRDFAEKLIEQDQFKPAFIELAPENWMKIGGYWKRVLDRAKENFPITAHGLSLSIGSPDPLDWDFIKDVKLFLKQYDIQIYSEHLSYSKSENAHLYDLLPIPFREDAIQHIVSRIKEVQDLLEQPIALENVSYYTPVGAEMSELEFLSQIVKESGCNLLLDVNNVYVNAFNHGYDAKEFIKNIPLDRVSYIHMAGHDKVSEDLIIDTHGQNIIDPVYDLFDYTISLLSPVPVLLERDFNIPSLKELNLEMDRLEGICQHQWTPHHVS